MFMPLSSPAPAPAGGEGAFRSACRVRCTPGWLLACLLLSGVLVGCELMMPPLTDEGVHYLLNDTDLDDWPACTEANAGKPCDCDDTRQGIYPGADEVCDVLDNDCDGLVDEGLPHDTFYRDGDGDGYGTPLGSVVACARPAWYVLNAEDCDDGRADAYPGAKETCNGTDDDCDGEADDGLEFTDRWPDADGDGFGNEAIAPTYTCVRAEGFSSLGGDCNDTLVDVHPGADELCSSTVDTNCDGTIGYRDEDGDGWAPCEASSGEASDCNDGDQTIHPAALEVCENPAIDNNCNGDTNDAPAQVWYKDSDGDGFGGEEKEDIDYTEGCDVSGHLLVAGDCDDDAPSVHPGAADTCNGIDDDCDFDLDEDSASLLWYSDADRDGYGDADAMPTADCQQPFGMVSNSLDCDDTDPRIHPGASETCSDGLDLNCDGSVGTLDLDLDGFDACEDCNDDPFVGADVYPGAKELCNGIDDDCDGVVDEVGESDWYRDSDHDGYGQSDNDPIELYGCSISGWSQRSKDCQDQDPAIYPGAVELCNGIDDDCDEALPPNEQDADLDGVRRCPTATLPADCNDDPERGSTIYPGAAELCDHLDNDCDELIDEDATLLWWPDLDGDGYGVPQDVISSCYPPQASYVEASRGTDCDDSNPALHPAANEVCDAADRDENCNGLADNLDSSADYATRVPSFTDSDGDGWGAGTVSWVCDVPAGRVSKDGDCDDTDPGYYPGALEVCDPASPDFGKDLNCDGTTADQNADGDAYPACQDCNDRNPDVHPDALERCNGQDDDCDGLLDDQDPELLGGIAYYPDADRDGFGDAASSPTSACVPPADAGVAWQLTNTDCQDQDASVHPDAPERCSTDYDDDCDGSVNEDDAADATRWYRDADADTFGAPDNHLTSCAGALEGYVLRAGDCNDTLSEVNPDQQEVCDTRELDEDCSGAADDLDLRVDPGTRTAWYPDNDRDGLGDRYDSGVLYCDPPVGYVADHSDCNDDSAAIGSEVNGTCPLPGSTCDSGGSLEDADLDGAPACSDCNDTDPSIYPNASETCNGLDDDCDEVVDEGVRVTYYIDADGDGFGSSSSLRQGCTAPTGYVAEAGDCDDQEVTSYPGADELCDQGDNDCDGITDEGLATLTWYRDADQDGYGSPQLSAITCDDLAPYYVLNSDDCNDATASVYPGAGESCNQADDNCDGAVDEGISTTLWYEDADRDGYGKSNVSLPRCSQPAGYVAEAGDCNDASVAVHPGAEEQCNFSDDDCDGSVDEELPAQTWFQDVDRDGHGDANSPQTACKQPGGYVSSAADCDDTRADVYPSATEKCDEADNNCDGDIDEGNACQCRVGLDPEIYPYSSVQDAVDAFELEGVFCDDDTIWVAPGTYADPIAINSSIRLRAESLDPSETILTLAGQSMSVVVIGPQADALLEGFTIRGGKGNPTCTDHSGYSCGGGIYLGSGGRVRLQRNVFLANTASYGGAIYVGLCPDGICSEAELIDNQLGPLPNSDGSCPSDKNKGSNGGSAVYGEAGAILRFSSNVISCSDGTQLTFSGAAPVALEGDLIQRGTSQGIDASGSTLNLDAVTVQLNSSIGINLSSSTLTAQDSLIASNGYGGIDASSSTLTLARTQLVKNSASSGGALYLRTSTLNATDSLFVGNSASSGYGGAIYARAADGHRTLTLERCTFDSNSAPRGAAVYLEGYLDITFHHMTAVIRNSLFLRNRSTSGEGGVLYGYYYATFDLQSSIFYANDLSANTGAAAGSLKVYNYSTATVSHNAFVDTRYATGSKACELYAAGDSTTSLTLWDNLLVGRGEAIGVCKDTSPTVNRLEENAIVGYWDELGGALSQTTFPAEKTLDPRFVSRPADLDWCYADLHLADDSPYLQSSLEDLDGDGLPDGGEYGAFGGTGGDWEPDRSGCE